MTNYPDGFDTSLLNGPSLAQEMWDWINRTQVDLPPDFEKAVNGFRDYLANLEVPSDKDLTPEKEHDD
jgi:hypothetical protein